MYRVCLIRIRRYGRYYDKHRGYIASDEWNETHFGSGSYDNSKPAMADVNIFYNTKSIETEKKFHDDSWKELN